jgi:DNA-directed RNA polymerase specialized sigma subunit
LLVELVQKGNIQAKDDLLYQLLGYIKTRLGKIISTDTRMRNNVDELVSYLMLWLVKLINQVSNGKPANNLLNYISKSVRFYCLRYLHTLPAYGPAERCCYSNIAQCNICLESIPILSDTVEFLDEVQSLAVTSDEHEYIRLRVEGYNNTEIAQTLKITTTDVSRIRKSLERRFNDAN